MLQASEKVKKEPSEGLERKFTVHEEEMCTTASELAHDSRKKQYKLEIEEAILKLYEGKV